MKRRPSFPNLALLSVLGACLVYGAKAAAFFDLGGDAILADLLGNSVKQLTTANDTLDQVKESNQVLQGLEEDREASMAGARSFQSFAARRFGKAYQSELDGDRIASRAARRSALDQLGLGNSGWAQIDVDCPGSVAGQPGCTPSATPPGTSEVLNALDATFGASGGPAQEVAVVDAEAAAAIASDLWEEHRSAADEERLRELAARCSQSPGKSGESASQGLAEQCTLASGLSQVLHLETGRETNAKLAQIARLQALGVEQRNAELRREILEQDARRAALTVGLESLARTRVAIRTAGTEL